MSNSTNPRLQRIAKAPRKFGRRNYRQAFPFLTEEFKSRCVYSDVHIACSGGDVAMHIAAIAPEFLTEADVDAETIAKEREIAANIAKKDGKPDAIIPKIVEGAVKKFYKENCLLTQQFVKDPKKTIQTVIDETAKAAGGKVELTKFLRFKAGEVAAATTEA